MHNVPIQYMIVNVVLVACLSVMEEDIQNLLISKQMITEQHQAVNAAAAVHFVNAKDWYQTGPRHKFSGQFPTLLKTVPRQFCCMSNNLSLINF